jgi:hypothetical protein
VTEAGQQELSRYYDEIARHHPDLLREMEPTNAQLATAELTVAGGGAVNARGPILNEAMNRFAAKLALALHFEKTGAIASVSATVSGRGTPTIKPSPAPYRKNCERLSALQARSFKVPGTSENNSSARQRTPRAKNTVYTWRNFARRLQSPEWL